MKTSTSTKIARHAGPPRGTPMPRTIRRRTFLGAALVVVSLPAVASARPLTLEEAQAIGEAQRARALRNAGQRPPTTGPVDHEAVVAAIFEAAGAPELPLPIGSKQPSVLVAWRAGFSMAVGNEATTADTLVYPWLISPEARNIAHSRALARAWMLREHVEHNGSDVALVADILRERLAA